MSMILDTIEITVFKGSNRIYREFFAPAFPHTKNLDEAFYMHGGEVKDLCGKVGTWEKIKDAYFQQFVICNKIKYKLIGVVHKNSFNPTAPMVLQAYEELKGSK